MKRLFKIFLIPIFLFGICSCDVMDLKPMDRLSDEDVWNDAALLQLYVNNCYNALPHGYRYTDMLGVFSDEMWTRSNDQFNQAYLQGDIDSDNIGRMGILNYWSDAYKNIRKINMFLIKAKEGSVADNIKEPMYGEMKFLRAFIYANLIWRYGGVPIVEGIFELDDESLAERNTYEECVNFIKKDLQEAKAILPDEQPAAQQGRASGDACQALLARVLLYWASPLNNPNNDVQRWKDAADAAKALIDTRYDLVDEYQDVFLTWNEEVIFARTFTQGNNTDFARWHARSGDFGQGIVTPTQNMVDAYEMKATGKTPYIEQADGTLVPDNTSGYDAQNPYDGRDPRFYASVLYDGAMWMNRETETYFGGKDDANAPSAPEPWNATETGYYLKKFMDESIPPSGSSLKMTSPWIFFRYAEILLNYAEASFEAGDENTARQYLNKVRERSSVDMPPVTDTGDNLRKRIQNERRVELAFEHHRFFDVRRWKIADITEKRDLNKMVINIEGGTKVYSVQVRYERDFKSHQLLLPIPRTEIDKSLQSIKQNPGYN